MSVVQARQRCLPPSRGAYAPLTRARGKRRALLISCSGKGLAPAQLDGAAADTARTQTMLTQSYGFKPQDIRVLSDESPSTHKPTANNIRIGLCWLMAGTKPGDKRFFHFSGYATQLPDGTGEAPDGRIS